MPRKKRAEEEEEVYHVEVITKARVSEDGEWEYLVKWAGYDSDADSWEPTENVQQCERLLTSFWKHVGMDDHDYPIGYEVAAEEDWVDKEKRYFAETFVKPSKRKSDKATKKDKQAKQKSKSSTPDISECTSDEAQSSDEVLTKETATRRPNRKPHVVDVRSESESDDRSHQVEVAPRPKVTTPPSRHIPKILNKVKCQELPSTTRGPLSIAPPKITTIRTHQEQRANPLVKTISLPSKSVEAGSSLSTKQRVASGILPQPTGPKALPSVPRKSLPSLSFKKNKPPVVPTSQVKDSISMPIASPASPASPAVQSKDVVNDVDVVASPQPMDIDQHIDLFDPDLDDTGLGGSCDVFTDPMPPKSQGNIIAETFLQTINLPGMNAPLDMAVMPDQPNQPIAELSRTLTISKIPKKWKWSGDLFISTSKSKTEPLCAVTISDPSGTSNGSHINLLLSSLDSLQISKLYSIMDLSFLLRACGKPQYFGRLESNESSDEEIIHGLEHHLAIEGLAAAIPLFLDGTEVAVLVVFSKAQQNMTKTLQVPEPLLSGTTPLVVLLPFLVSAMTSTNAAGWRSIVTVMQSPFIPQNMPVSHDIFHEDILYQAMFLLGFPKALLDFLNNPFTIRAYCIWPLPDQLSPGLDTIMLQYVLNSTKAVLAKPEEDVRVVFISSRHLEKLHTMPSLVAKQVNSPEVQFWTYGYSTSMIYEKWKFQEIYPLGGVVTFTASALAENVIGCQQLISQIIEHPLWDCYLLPEVLAASHQLCSNGDLSCSSISYLNSILDLATLGLVPVIRIPGKEHLNQMTWLSQVFNQSNASGHQLLEFCLDTLRSQNIPAEQLIAFTNNEIVKDHSSAQTQSAFMNNYRRFTVIRAASEDTIPFDKDGLEWSSLSLFSFKDDYFQQ